MSYKTTELIKAEMDKNELKYFVKNVGDKEVLGVRFSVHNGPNVKVNFICGESVYMDL